jgi:hypothetical protein
VHAFGSRETAAELVPPIHSGLPPKLSRKIYELQAINYSITREKAPLYTMGSADCRSYSRNKHGIADGLIWINFDRHSLLTLFKKAQGRFVADTGRSHFFRSCDC